MSWEELQRLNKAIENARRGLDKFGTKSPQGLLAKAEIKSLKSQKAQLPPEILRRERVETLTKKLTQAVYDDMLGRAGGKEIPTYIGGLEYEGISDTDIQKVIADTREQYRSQAQTITLKELQQKLEASLIDHYEATHKPLRIDVQNVVDGTSTIDTSILAYIQRAVALHLDIETIQAHINEVLHLPPTEKARKLQELTHVVKAYLADAEFKAELDASYRVPKNMVIEIQIWESSDDAFQPTEAQRKILRAKRNLEIYGVPRDDIHQAIHAARNKPTNS